MNERDSIGFGESIAQEYNIYSSLQQKKTENKKNENTLLVLLHVFCVAIISVQNRVSFVSFSLLFYIILKCVDVLN